MVGLGILGAFLPVMPSTIFFIFAAYFFSRSSQRLEHWLLNHPRFGKTLRTWKNHKALTIAGRNAAFTGMTVGLVLLLVSAAPPLVKVFGGLFIIGSAIYVGRLPTISH